MSEGMYHPACLDRDADSIKGVSIQGFLVDGSNPDAIVAGDERGAIGVVGTMLGWWGGVFLYRYSPHVVCRACLSYLSRCYAISLGV